MTRNLLGLKSDEITGEWRRLHNEELYGLYCLSNIIRVIISISMRWTGHVACMAERRGAYRFWVGKREGKTLHGKHRCRWEDNIKKNFQEVRSGVMEWNYLG